MSRARLEYSEKLSRMSQVQQNDDKLSHSNYMSLLLLNDGSNGDDFNLVDFLHPETTTLDDPAYLNEINMNFNQFLSTRDPEISNEKTDSNSTSTSTLNYCTSTMTMNDKNSDPLLNLVPMDEILCKTDTKCDNDDNKPVWEPVRSDFHSDYDEFDSIIIPEVNLTIPSDFMEGCEGNEPKDTSLSIQQRPPQETPEGKKNTPPKKPSETKKGDENCRDDGLHSIVTDEGVRLWVCPEAECARGFNAAYLLQAHMLGHFAQKPFKCDFPGCRWSFYTSFKLKRHAETHAKRKDFTCPVLNCNRNFTTIYNLNTHIKLHERPARLKCMVKNCNIRFQTRRAMEAHLKSHDLSLAPYKCSAEDCFKVFFSHAALIAHMRVHSHKEEELHCRWENCGRVFDKPCRLRAHMRCHTGDKPFQCHYSGCHWAFTSSSKLKRHQLRHNNDRRFRCTIGDCTKAFMRSEHLREHTFTHIAQRTFQCDICGKECSAKATLYVHKKKFHSNETNGSTQTKPKRKPKPKIIKSCARTYMPYEEKEAAGTLETPMPTLPTLPTLPSEDVLLGDDPMFLDGSFVSPSTKSPATSISTISTDMSSSINSDMSTTTINSEMYQADEESDYILLFKRSDSSGYPASTVNLKDLD